MQLSLQSCTEDLRAAVSRTI